MHVFEKHIRPCKIKKKGYKTLLRGDRFNSERGVFFFSSTKMFKGTFRLSFEGPPITG